MNIPVARGQYLIRGPVRRLNNFFAAVLALFATLECGCHSHVQRVPPRLPNGEHASIDVHVYVTDDFSLKEYSNIVNGVLLWERATHGMVTWKPQTIKLGEVPKEEPLVRPDGTQQLVVVFHKAHSSDEWVKHWDEKRHSKGSGTLLGMCFGSYSRERTRVWLVMDRLHSDNTMTWTVAHEFGHAIGLDHIDDKASIMSPHYNWRVKQQTAQDMVEFCRVWGCEKGI